MSSLQYIKNFVSFAAKHLGLKAVPKINFVGSVENKKATFGHFLKDNKGESITIRVTDRHPIDVMRTIAHELYHHKQRLSGVNHSERVKEDEANAIAGRIMRAYDTKYPGAFNLKPIKEDTGSVVAGGGEMVVGTGDNSDPSKPLAQPLFKKKLRRIVPKKVEENTIFHKKKLNLGMNVGERDGERASQPMKKKFGLLDNNKTRFGDQVKREQDPTKREGGRTAPAFQGKKISVGV